MAHQNAACRRKANESTCKMPYRVVAHRRKMTPLLQQPIFKKPKVTLSVRSPLHGHGTLTDPKIKLRTGMRPILRYVRKSLEAYSRHISLSPQNETDKTRGRATPWTQTTLKEPLSIRQPLLRRSPKSAQYSDRDDFASKS